jgi:hypothetical protein
MSTYEGEHMIFGLLGQANLTQSDVLQFHPFGKLFLISIGFIPKHLGSLGVLANGEFPAPVPIMAAGLCFLSL